jgi:membrane-associated phospholipid phosphatase
VRSVTLALAASLLCVPAPARADEAVVVRPEVDVPVTAVAGAAWIASEALKASIVPARCRSCDRDGLGRDTLDGFDTAARDALVWSDPKLADTISNGTAFVLSPVVTLGSLALAATVDGHADEAWKDGLVSLEAAVLAADLNQAVKFTAMRERPFVHALPASSRGASADENLSFYSGHTSLAFSLAVSAGTVASMRHRKLAPAVWAAGLSIAAVTGWLRVAADKHYASDVLTGAGFGSLVGFAVPWLLHAPATTRGGVAWRVVGVPGGLGVAASY